MISLFKHINLQTLHLFCYFNQFFPFQNSSKIFIWNLEEKLNKMKQKWSFQNETKMIILLNTYL